MGGVARRVGHRADFFDLLRRIVALRKEIDRKNNRCPIAAVELSIIRQSPRLYKTAGTTTPTQTHCLLLFAP